MLLKTQDYNIKLTYKPGTKIPVADAHLPLDVLYCILAAPTPSTPGTWGHGSRKVVALSRILLNATEEISFIEIEHQDNLAFSTENMNSIKEATANDTSLIIIRNTIMQDWPENRVLVC